jgi:hypothetical protein
MSTRQVHIFPGPIVEYRQTMGQGEQIVRVMLNLTTPRIIVMFQKPDSPAQPLSLFIDEIEGFVADAKTRITALTSLSNGG